jgi:SNF2 family DNA or RNA helicase
MSVIENWVRETRRFTPGLRPLVHHGAGRLAGSALVEAARNSDIVLTTYALAHRDREPLSLIPWRRIALDEAQNVKNPAARQSRSIRDMSAQSRVALTGTPVENRLTELWSIMEFCNPGLLGSGHDFRRRFAAPIERNRDKARARQLRALIRPFVLRRLKTDPNVSADLPPKVETKEWCRLTTEQATLYEAAVKRMLADADKSEGIARRGIVLASLVRLKQICNHPSHFLKDHDFNGADPPDPRRSGKCARLLSMLEEVVAEGDQALVFTQFREMGRLLQAMLSHGLDRETLFLHGGTPARQRQEMIDRFQSADRSAPVFIVSLKAGGVGLNLTAATHVFHFDRWWNPAVENQATDRAHRIGQTRSVQVHKFIVAGALEERIDEMIERKTDLAQNIVGAGESWLTELSTAQLRDLVTLGADAIEDDEDETAPAPAADLAQAWAAPPEEADV